MTKNPKKTKRRLEMDKRNAMIIKERAELLSVDGAMPTAVDAFLQSKYKLTRASIWRIVNNR